MTLRRVYDDLLPIDKDQIVQSLSILRDQFPLVKEEEIQKIPDRLRRPDRHGLLAMLFVANDIRTNRVAGLAIREPRYRKPVAALPLPTGIPEDRKIRLVVSREHVIHHIHERGFVEAPVEKKRYSEEHVKKVHDPKLVDYIKRMSAELAPDASIYPYVFPIRNPGRVLRNGGKDGVSDLRREYRSRGGQP